MAKTKYYRADGEVDTVVVDAIAELVTTLLVNEFAKCLNRTTIQRMIKNTLCPFTTLFSDGKEQDIIDLMVLLHDVQNMQLPDYFEDISKDTQVRNRFIFRVIDELDDCMAAFSG